KQGINLWLESGAEIKLRSGIQRNKNDKIDAERIALYGKRYVDKANLQHSEDQVLKEAEFLLTERELYIKERAKYRQQIKDFKSFIRSEEHTSELQSRFDLVCRLLLVKKKT